MPRIRPFIRKLMMAAILALLPTAPAQADWSAMTQATFDNITYTNLTNVGIASMCGPDGVCQDERKTKRAGAKTPKDWLAAAKLAAGSSVSPVSLGYDRDPAVTAEVEASILDEARKRNPRGAAALQATFRKHDMIAVFDHAIARYGLRSDNLADVLASYWVLNWMVANRIPGDGSRNPSSKQMRAVRDQLGRAMAYDPALAAISNVERQKLAESLIYNILILDGAHTQASAPGKEGAFRQLSQVWWSHGRDFLGIDFRQLDLTNRGFVRKG